MVQIKAIAQRGFAPSGTIPLLLDSRSALPTETKVESGTSQRKSGTSVHSGKSGEGPNGALETALTVAPAAGGETAGGGIQQWETFAARSPSGS